MASITNIADTDLITDGNAVINVNFTNLNNDKVETSVIDTDTTLAADSDTKLPSQKAVKAYVDAGGNVNASTTTKGIVEEATQAEVDAQTATGATGARLFVNPSTRATIDLASEVTGVLPVANGGTGGTNLFQQSIPSLDFLPSGFGATSDGSAFYILDTVNKLYRYEKDAGTGWYKLTHTITMTFIFDSPHHGIVSLGNYIYIFGDDNTNVQCRRFLASDLTGETAMTVPTVGNANNSVDAWTDGTDFYIVATDSQTTSRKWSLSGTTLTAVSTATVTTGTFVNTYACTVFNGTDIFVVDNASATTVTIKKLTTADGSATTSTSYALAEISGVDVGVVAIPLSATTMYIGKMSKNYNTTGITSQMINLYPITSP